MSPPSKSTVCRFCARTCEEKLVSRTLGDHAQRTALVSGKDTKGSMTDIDTLKRKIIRLDGANQT